MHIWLFDPSNRLILWIVIGVAAVLVLYLLLKLLPNAKTSASDDFPTDTREANLLALGLQPLEFSGNCWNDPTASSLIKRKKLRSLAQSQWGLRTPEDVERTVQDLVTHRRRRERWQQMLAVRQQLATQKGGQRPNKREWLAAIRASDSMSGGEEKRFVDSVHTYEKKLGKDNKALFPDDAPVISFDAYALGQAVAVAVWGVGLGLISRERSMQLVEGVNLIARREFPSWAAFGRSYVLGRAMDFTDKMPEEKVISESESAVFSMISALNGKRQGPWGKLPWNLEF